MIAPDSCIRQGVDHRQQRRLDTDRPTLGGHGENLVVERVPATPQSKVEPPVAGLIENPHLFGDRDRMHERRQDDGRADSDALCETQQVAGQRQRLGADAEVDEVMFGHPETVVTQQLRQLRRLDGQPQRRAIVDSVKDAVVEEQSDLHVRSSFAALRWQIAPARRTCQPGPPRDFNCGATSAAKRRIDSSVPSGSPSGSM